MPELLSQENKSIVPEGRQEAAVATGAAEPAVRTLRSYGSFGNYLKSRVDKENRFGSFVLGTSWIASFLKLKGSLDRKVNGVPAPDRKRTVTYVGSLSGYSWSFFSARGGRFPEGKTVFARVINALRHPQQSATQFEFVVWFPLNVLQIYNNAEKGLKAFGVGLKESEKAYTPEKVRLLSAAIATAWQACTGYGHFKKRDDKPQQEKEQVTSPKSGTGMLRNVWKHDRFLFLGAIFNIAMQAVGVTEGIRKWNTSRKEAIDIISGASITGIMSTLYNLYIFQRIDRSNFKKKDENTTGRAEATVSESPPCSCHSEVKGFAQKVTEQKQPHAARHQPFNSFAEQAASTVATGMSY